MPQPIKCDILETHVPRHVEKEEAIINVGRKEGRTFLLYYAFTVDICLAAAAEKVQLADKECSASE